MLEVFVGILMIVAGVTANELCRDPVHQVCRDDDSPKNFPETVEEFQDFCNFALGFLRCGVKYGEKCDPSDEHSFRSYLTAFEGVCSEDTLLYAAIVDNLQCFNELRKNGALQECDTVSYFTPMETVHNKYAKALVEEGHPGFSDDESEANHTLICILNLLEMACYASTLEDKCGTIAMDTFVEVIQQFRQIEFCGETYYYLPTVLRVYKIEQQEANEIAEVFKKRK